MRLIIIWSRNWTWRAHVVTERKGVGVSNMTEPGLGAGGRKSYICKSRRRSWKEMATNQPQVLFPESEERKERRKWKAHLGAIKPRRYIQQMILKERQVKISHHSIIRYGLTSLAAPRRLYMIIVCLMAVHVVRKPKPRVKPQTRLASTTSFSVTVSSTKVEGIRVSMMVLHRMMK